MKRFVSLFVQALNGYLLVASLLVSCTHMQLPHSPSPEDTPLSPPTRGTTLPETAIIPPSTGVLDTSESLASPDVSHVQYGTASWYGRPFHGRRTANGETYDMYEVTAAHRTAPLGTYALVTNLTNGQAVQVRINDRGPFIRQRILDLSYGAAQELGMVTAGIARVKVEFLASEAAAAGNPPQIARLPAMSAHAMQVTWGVSRQALVAPYMMPPPSTRLPACEMKSPPQTGWPGDNVLACSQEQPRTFLSRAVLESNALRYGKVHYARAAVAVARSPAMGIAMGIAMGQAAIPPS